LATPQSADAYRKTARIFRDYTEGSIDYQLSTNGSTGLADPRATEVLLGLNLDPVVEAYFVSRLTAKTPAVFRCLRDRHLEIGGSQVQLSLRSLEQQANEVFLRLD
jgi:hypothetical protein